MTTRLSEFVKSPHGGSYLSIAGLVLAVISTVISIMPLVVGRGISNELEWIVVSCLLLLTITMLFMYRMFMEQHDKAIVLQEVQNSLHDKEKAIESLKYEIYDLNNRRAKAATIFKDLNVERSKYSGILHRIQDLILAAPTERTSEVFFPHLERRYREMLEDVCDHCGHVFEAEKGGEFSVNIKFIDVVDRAASRPSHRDFLHVAGISRLRPPPPNAIAYQTVARCFRSRQKSRGINRKEEAMTVQSNLLLRNLVLNSAPALVIDNVGKFIDEHRALVQKKEIPDFVYPDQESVGAYTSALVVPIVGEFNTQILEPDQYEILVEDQIHGVLVVDSLSENAFNDKMDITTCQEIAAMIMSIRREYARCLSHQQARQMGFVKRK